MPRRTSTTVPTAAAAWRRSAPERPLVWLLAALAGVLLAFGLAACGSSSPKAHETPLVTPALVPPKDSAASGTQTTDTTSTTDTISTTDTTGSSASTSSGSTGSTGSGQTAGTATPPAAPAGPSGGATPPATGTKTTGTGDPSGGAGVSAFCQKNPGAC